MGIKNSVIGCWHCRHVFSFRNIYMWSQPRRLGLGLVVLATTSRALVLAFLPCLKSLVDTAYKNRMLNAQNTRTDNIHFQVTVIGTERQHSNAYYKNAPLLQIAAMDALTTAANHCKLLQRAITSTTVLCVQSPHINQHLHNKRLGSCDITAYTSTYTMVT